MRGQKSSIVKKQEIKLGVPFSERYSFGTARRAHTHIFRERVSLISFHRLINQKQEDWNNDKEKNFYPQGNGAFLFCWWFLWLAVSWDAIFWNIFRETFLHSEVTVLYRPASSSFDWSTAASTIKKKKVYLKEQSKVYRKISVKIIFSECNTWNIALKF